MHVGGQSVKDGFQIRTLPALWLIFGSAGVVFRLYRHLPGFAEPVFACKTWTDCGDCVAGRGHKDGGQESMAVSLLHDLVSSG